MSADRADPPFAPADVTATWLTGALRGSGALPLGRVASVAAEPLGAGKGMAGHLARLRVAYDGEVPGAPRTLVAKCSPADPQARALQNGIGIHEREVRFYELLAGRSPLRTPSCHASAFDPAGGRSLLLLEDLSDAVNGSWLAGCSLAEAELVVDALAGHHAVFWMDERLAGYRWLDLKGALSVEAAPDAYRGAWEAFLRRSGASVAPEVLQTGDLLARHLAWLYPLLHAQPPFTLVHNDASADNLFFVPGPSVVVADWQLATRGRGAVDVATFLGGSLDPEVRRAHEERLLRAYHARLVEGGVTGYPWERCRDDYRLAALAVVWRLIGVVGMGIVPPALEAGFRDVLIPRACRAACQLAAPDLLAREAFDPGRKSP